MKLVAGYIYSDIENILAQEVELTMQKESILQACQKKDWLMDFITDEALVREDIIRPKLLKTFFDMPKNNIKIIVVSDIKVVGDMQHIRRTLENDIGYYDYKIYSASDNTLYDLSLEEDEKSKKLRKVESKIRDIPSLPEVVTKVMELVQDPKSSAQKLSNVIACDPGMTSRVLRLVNSAYYGFPRQISSIQQAIAMVGFTTIRGLVLSSSIFRIFTPKTTEEKAFDHKKFWKHCLVTSVAAKQINKYLYKNEDENLFSAAMLHDIGKIVLDQYDHENYIKAYNSTNDIFDDQLLLATERRHCVVAHTEVGNFIAEKWNLPAVISDSMMYHHNPREMRQINPLVVIVYMANIFANAYLEEVDVFFEMFDEELLDFVGIDKDAINKLTDIIKDELDDMGQVESFYDDKI